MTRRTAMTISLAAAAARTAGAASGAKTVLEPFNYSGVRLLDGMLRRQCLSVRDTFLQVADDDLLYGFRKRFGAPEPPGKPLGGWYGGDVFNAFGQYLSGMIRLARGLDDTAIGEKARRLMIAWAQCIEPDGYFFYSRRPVTPHYIYDKMMCGLVDLTEFGPFREAVPLMEKITGWAETNLDRSRKRPLADGATYDGNGEWYTLGENLYRAYQLTGDTRYRTFADVWRYPGYWDMFTRSETPDLFGFHAYSHVNTLSSAAMAYSVSGDSHYLDVIRNAYDWLARTQMYATGGFGPDEKLQRPDGSLGRSLQSTWNNFETVCGSWAGFKLARYLMQFTGEARYGDWIEKLVYNGVGAALPLQLDGSNFYYSEYNVKGGRKDYKYAKWSCCSGTLPQVTADYHNVIYFRNTHGLFVNLFVPSEAKWNQGGSSITAIQTTNFPEAAETQLDLALSESKTFDVNFRVPAWCDDLSIEVNAQPVPNDPKPGTWATIRRSWRAGDRIKVRLLMKLRYEAVDRQHPDRVAIVYGPVVLVRSQRPRLTGQKELSALLKRSGSGLEFQAESAGPIQFTPFYKLSFSDLYEMYFDRS